MQDPATNTSGGDGPLERSARAAAQRLTGDYGPHLTSEVEAALYTAGSTQRLEQYFDPLSLAALIVSTAQFGWQVYQDLNRQTPKPSQEVIERRVRVELSGNNDVFADDRNRVISVVTEEIVRLADESKRG